MSSGTTIKSPQDVLFGVGLIQYKPYESVINDWTDLGGQADTVLSYEATSVQLEDGLPLQVLDERISANKGTLNVNVSENTVKEILLRLGQSSSSQSSSVQASATETEVKTFTGTAFEALGLVPYSATPSISVALYPAITTSCVLNTDYILGEKNGRQAIRRISGGNIVDGAQARVTVTYTKPARNIISVGGNSIKDYYKMRHISPPNSKGYSVISTFPKATAGGSATFNFNNKEYSKSPATFTIVKDPGESALFTQEFEKA